MNTAEMVCKTVYEETRRFAPIAEDCRQQSYEILLSPPLANPSIAFVGFQPGGDGSNVPEDASKRPWEISWPETSHYVSEPWPLARQLRTMFGIELLRKSVGLNAIFVGARNIREYETQILADKRMAIERFCLDRVDRMLTAMEPEKVVLIGFATQRLFPDYAPVETLQNLRGRVLAKKGILKGRTTTAVLHLSGARISNIDRRKIADFVSVKND